MIQKILSRYEYPIGNQSVNDVFDEFRGMFVAVAEGSSIIVLTYTEDEEILLRLKLSGRKDVKHNRYS